MKHRPRAPEQHDLLRPRLVDMIDPRHELVTLAALIDVVDTTVMEKAIAYPTDSQLYDRARRQLVALAREAGVDLRQTYARLAPRLALQVGRHAHARQFRRMRKALKKLKGYTGRVMRDLRRHLDDIPMGALRDRILAKLALVSQLLHQHPRGGARISALHEPEADCISNGKARVRYEFGCKVSVATTLDEGFVVGMRSFPGNPHDGHTLGEALEQEESLTDRRPDLAAVDRGYCGYGVTRTRVLISGMRRGLTQGLIADLRRRGAIKAEIGNMKTDGCFARCTLKATLGDSLYTVLSACGQNIRKFPDCLRSQLAPIIAVLLAAAIPKDRVDQTAIPA